MKNETQTEQIRNYLEEGGELTQLDAIVLFGCLRLGARIWDLKKIGVPVKKETVNKNNKHFAKYYIDD